MLPTYVGDADPLLQRLAKPDLRHVADFWLLNHRDLRDNARLRAARACITRTMTEHAALFRGELAGGAKMRARVTNLRQAKGRRVSKNRRA